MDRRGLSGELRRTHREPGGMAHEGGRPAAGRRRGDHPGTKSHRAQRELASELARRHRMYHVPGGAYGLAIRNILKLALLAALLVAAAPAFSAEKILAARVWPAQEYT